MEKIRQDTSPNALRGIEICESRVNNQNDLNQIKQNDLFFMDFNKNLKTLFIANGNVEILEILD
jgi:hypothetical protein